MSDLKEPRPELKSLDCLFSFQGKNMLWIEIFKKTALNVRFSDHHCQVLMKQVLISSRQQKM